MMSEVGPRQDFKGRGHYGNINGQSCNQLYHDAVPPSKQCPSQVSTSYTLKKDPCEV